MLIFYKGLPLYILKNYEVRAIDDEDVVTSVFHATFLSVQETIAKGDEKSLQYMKLKMSRYTMHIILKRFFLKGNDAAGANGNGKKEIYLYIVEDMGYEEKHVQKLTNKILNEFIQLFGHDLEKFRKRPGLIDKKQFDDFTKKTLGFLTEKQYTRFFNLWNRPRFTFSFSGDE